MFTYNETFLYVCTMIDDKFEIELLENAREFLRTLDKKEILVICTHGFIKKTQKVPAQEIEKARRLMRLYFEIY